MQSTTGMTLATIISEETFHKLYKFEIHPGDFIMSGAGTIGRISRVPEGIRSGRYQVRRFQPSIDTIQD
jgi:type I restriction enzyme S subunit